MKLTQDGIHTCHDECQRSACVARRNAYKEAYEAGRKDENEAIADAVSKCDARATPKGIAAAIRARREQ